eukprot:4127631-Pyramimonas_sp.AAC.1
MPLRSGSCPDQRQVFATGELVGRPAERRDPRIPTGGQCRPSTSGAYLHHVLNDAERVENGARLLRILLVEARQIGHQQFQHIALEEGIHQNLSLLLAVLHHVRGRQLVQHLDSIHRNVWVLMTEQIEDASVCVQAHQLRELVWIVRVFHAGLNHIAQYGVSLCRIYTRTAGPRQRNHEWGKAFEWVIPPCCHAAFSQRIELASSSPSHPALPLGRPPVQMRTLGLNISPRINSVTRGDALLSGYSTRVKFVMSLSRLRGSVAGIGIR